MKKILIGIVVVLVLFFGGLTIFVNTKSDFIIQKVSEILESSLNAKLEMENLPEISIFPSLSVSAGKSSLKAPDFSLTFNSASVNVSLTKLFSGTVQIHSVALDTLNLEYTAAAPKQDSAAKDSEASQSQPKNLEEIFALVPAEISVVNSNISYKDAAMAVELKNINARIEDFGINKNSSVNLQGTVAYKDKTQNIAFGLDTAADFLFMGQSLEYNIKTFNFTPISGFPFTQPVDITAESSMNFNPLIIEKLNGVIKSPFAELTLKGNGDDKKSDLTVSGDVFPVAIQENFLPDTRFANLPKTIKLNAALSNTPDSITIKEVLINAHDGLVKLSGHYDTKKKDLQAKLYTENIAVQDYLPKTAEKSAKKTQTANTAESKASSSQNNTNLTFNVTADAKKISYNEYTIDAVHSIITGKITGKEKVITVKPLTVTKENESIQLSAKLELEPKDLITVSLDGQNLDAKKWTKGLVEKSPLDAKLSAKTALTFKSADPLNTLNGSGQISGSALRIETKLLPFITNLLQLNITLQDFYEFATLNVPYTIKNGLLSTTNTYVNSPAVFINANGTTHLAKQSLSFAGKAELKKQGLIFPYKVSGTYSNPKIGLDLEKQLEVLGKGILHTGESLGTGAVEGGKTIGNGVIDGGKAIGGGLEEGGKLLEEGLGKLFK